MSKSEILIKLKDADEAMDPNEMAFSLIHPDVLRRLCFAVEERQEESFRRAFGIGNGYGRVIDDTYLKSDIPIIRADELDTKEDSHAWIEKMLRKFGLWKDDEE